MKIFSVLISFIPEQWKKNIALLVIGAGFITLTSMLVRTLMVEEAKATYKAMHEQSIEAITSVSYNMNANSQSIQGLKVELKEQGSKIDRMDGKMDTVIYLLKK